MTTTYVAQNMPKLIDTSQNEKSTQTVRILMIDLENCPNQIHQLMNHLEQYSQIVVCYAQSGAKIPLDWLLPLTAIVNENRLKIVKMPNAGKNSADFGITFWAGVLMGKMAADAHFDIVSNDADLDHVVSLLADQKRSAKRIGPPKENEQGPSALKNPLNAAQEYCRHLEQHQKSRPVKKETLLNSIKSKFNGAGINAEALFEQLINHDVIVLKDNKISYNQKKIAVLAKPQL